MIHRSEETRGASMALSKTKLLAGAALGWRCHMDEILLLFLISVSVINRNEDVSHNANLK